MHQFLVTIDLIITYIILFDTFGHRIGASENMSIATKAAFIFEWRSIHSKLPIQIFDYCGSPCLEEVGARASVHMSSPVCMSNCSFVFWNCMCSLRLVYLKY